MTARLLRLWAAVIAVVAVVRAQDLQPAATFRTQTKLVLVPFHVQREGRYVENLTSGSVVLLEDGVPRTPSIFDGGVRTRRTTPLDLAVVVDVTDFGASAAEWNPEAIFSFLLPASEPGLREMLARILSDFPEVRLSVYRIRATRARASGAAVTDLRRLLKPSRDVAALGDAFRKIMLVDPGGEKIPLELPAHRAVVKAKNRLYGGIVWIYESMIAASKDMAGTGEPGATLAMLVFSTGLSGTSSTAGDAVAVARQNGVPIYPVMVDRQRWKQAIDDWRAQMSTYNADLGARRAASGRAPVGSQVDRDLQGELDEMDRFGTIGDLTGAKAFDYNTVTLPGLSEILVKMRVELESQYVVGLVPHPTEHPKLHKLEIKLTPGQSGKVLGGVRTIVY